MTHPTTLTAARRTLRLGTRASALATAQSRLVAAALQDAVPGLRVELTPVTTQGDTDPRSLAEIGGTGVFAAALRTALRAEQVDLAVHSLKDLPAVQPADLVVAAVPAREDPRDAFVGRDGLRLADLPPGARVGTGSPRRASQLLAVRPDLDVVDLRGNVDTRLAAVASGRLDGVVLALAGLRRLGRAAEVTEILDVEAFAPAPGQGALAVECRAADADVVETASGGLDNGTSHLEVTAERAVLVGLAAGCSTPIGALAQWRGTELVLSASVGGAVRVTRAARIGSPTDEDTDAGQASGARRGMTAAGARRGMTAAGARRGMDAAVELGRTVATELLALGAGTYLGGADGHETAMGTH